MIYLCKRDRKRVPHGKVYAYCLRHRCPNLMIAFETMPKWLGRRHKPRMRVKY